MPTRKARPATRSCSTPMELTSMKQYSQPACTIWAISELMVMGSEVVLTASNSFLSTKLAMVESRPQEYPRFMNR